MSILQENQVWGLFWVRVTHGNLGNDSEETEEYRASDSGERTEHMEAYRRGLGKMEMDKTDEGER